MFSSEMTELSMTREKASASPPRIIVFTVLPIMYSTTNVASAESGIDSSTAKVARMLPRKIRIIRLVSTSPMTPSWSTVLIASFTNTDWSKATLGRQLPRHVEQVADQIADAVDDLDRVRVAALLHDRDVRRPLAVDPHDVVLHLARSPSLRRCRRP